MTLYDPTVLEYVGLSDIGTVRSENQDRWFADPDLGLFLVADGLGGHAAGAFAAQLVVDVLPQLVRHIVSNERSGGDAETHAGLVDQVRTLSQLVYEETRGQASLRGTGTTLVLALVGTHGTTIVHVGDSRAYLFQNAQLRRLTEDHTLGRLFRSIGQLPESGMRHHSAAHRLTRYIGTPAALTPDLQMVAFAGGDLLLLCSDGIHGQLEDTEISAILGSGGSVRKIGQELIAAANASGGLDNATVLLISRRG